MPGPVLRFEGGVCGMVLAKLKKKKKRSKRLKMASTWAKMGPKALKMG